MTEQLKRATEKELFFSLLTQREKKRVDLLVEIIGAYPLPKKDYLWVAGVGSLAKGDANARDIDIVVCLPGSQRKSFNDHLKMSFEKHKIDCTQDTRTGFLGLPVFVRKNQRWSDESGRAIELIVLTAGGNPEALIYDQRHLAHAVEFLRKGV